MHSNLTSLLFKISSLVCCVGSKESPSVLLFLEERLYITESRAFKVTKSQCSGWITQSVGWRDTMLKGQSGESVDESREAGPMGVSLGQLKRQSSKSPPQPVLTGAVWVVLLPTTGTVFLWFQNNELFSTFAMRLTV